MLYRAMSAETVNIKGNSGDSIEAYVARPTAPGRYGSMIVVHHMPGWDEWTTEVARRFAAHGYNAIAPNLHSRFGPGTPEEMSNRQREAGGQDDAIVLGDLRGAEAYLRGLPTSNGKIGIIGFCSGGRVVYIAACNMKLDAAINCWGGNVVTPPDRLTPRQPKAPIDMTANMSAPMLGFFGNEDQNPSPEHVNRIEAELKKHNKQYEFHRYDGAGHAFFAWERPLYRQAQAVDGWQKVWAFCEKHLMAPAPAAAG
jgi:carboxymethylenebutenolidase